MFAVIHVPQFALQAALRHEPELWARPVALVDPALSTPRVCDATPRARALGVTDGLTPTQALARCRDVLIRHRSPAQEAAATEAVLQCAYGFSPSIENTSPGAVTLDLHGLAELNVGQASSLSAFSVGSTGDSPVPVGDSPTGTTKSQPSRANALWAGGPAVPSGESPDGTGQWPVLPAQNAYRRDARPTMAWAERLHAALTSLNLRARIGIGATPNIARHAAHWTASRSRRREEADLPAVLHPPSHVGGDEAISIVTDPPAFVAALPVAALEPSTDVAHILHKWGIRTVGELLALGPDAVTDRLGLEALALFAAASTRALRPLNLVRPAEHYEEMFEFEHEIETVEPLLFILRRFVEYLSQRLELSGSVAALVTLRLRLESGEALERRLRLPQPTRQADVLFRMLQTHLETLRTDSAIVAVALKADPTQPEQKQFSLFEAALRDPQQFQETLARLSALVGAERVGTPVRENSHRPDAFQLVPPDFENAPGVIPGRVPEILRPAPLRRFRPALQADVESLDGSKIAHGGDEPSACSPGFSLSCDIRRAKARTTNPRFMEREPAFHPGERERQPPLSLRCAVANGKLVLAIGPWRASGRWWEPGAWQREEWDVETSRGMALRLVQCPEGWFVEGVAD